MAILEIATNKFNYLDDFLSNLGSQQQADRLKTRPAPMLRQHHATFLAVEVLVPFVHRNILCYAPWALGVALDV
ncbi:MAG: hypothetical protein Q8L76_14805 [Cypionkella sp.]|nr:hypothetical protein [Cypionkella sp.]